MATGPTPKTVGVRRWGSVEADDPAVAAGLDLDASWPVHSWLGGWDADALCGYAHGRLEIPLSGA